MGVTPTCLNNVYNRQVTKSSLPLSLPPSLQLNMVFDGMRATKDFNGYVVFLEEDHYLSPDFLYMTEKLIALKEE